MSTFSSLLDVKFFVEVEAVEVVFDGLIVFNRFFRFAVTTFSRLFCKLVRYFIALFVVKVVAFIEINLFIRFGDVHFLPSVVVMRVMCSIHV